MMKIPIYPILALASALFSFGCERRTDFSQGTDLVFNISKLPPGPDGRPVIDIQPNGKIFPPSTNFRGKYFLMVRRNGVAFFMRYFDPDDVAKGGQRDLNISSLDFKADEKITVDVENIVGDDPSKYTRLSNIIDVTKSLPSNEPVVRVKPKIVQ